VALGSRAARGLLPETDRAAVLRLVDASASSFRNSRSLYGRYLGCLAALFDEPAPAARTSCARWRGRESPARRRSAGGPQLRHAWVLHAKQNEMLLSAHALPAGFVEANPSSSHGWGALPARPRGCSARPERSETTGVSWSKSCVRGWMP